MTRQPTLADKHSLWEGILFRVKAALLSLRRALKNLLHPTKRFATASARQGTELARSESELWNAGDNTRNWLLTAGKVQNLRTAIKYLDGLEIPAGQTFSFWKHIGNPNTNRSFVVGRELREGCIIPTKAGGLCQLSNALYDAALKAGFEIIERHKHTQVIPGSLAEQGRDATVKWNYIDLRFRSKHRFTISAHLTDTQLIVRFIAIGNGLEITLPQNNIPQQAPAKLNDCYSCGNMACFKHPGQTPAMDTNGITAFILDEYWPEFDAYVKSIADPNDAFIVPAVNNRWMGRHRQGWTVNTTNVKTGGLAAIRREVLLRLKIKRGENIFSSQLQTDRQYAQSLIKRIPVQAKHLVVSQNLLPFLWESGALGGRTFDVLLTRLPIELLHERLDAAHAKFSNSKTLNDFRAGQSLIDLENSALTKARHVVTPHAALAEIFGNK